jgi:molecular chaperone GrpE (heat shock protein)
MLIYFCCNFITANGDAAMKIHIDIDLKLSNAEELDILARFIKNFDAMLKALEAEVENYRRRLEQVEEMTTHFESSQEEN